MVYVFGFDMPLIEVLILLIFLSLLILILILVWYFRNKKLKEEIEELFELIINLKESERNRLLRLPNLTPEEKLLLREINSLKDLKINPIDLKRIRKKKKQVKSVWSKIRFSNFLEKFSNNKNKSKK